MRLQGRGKHYHQHAGNLHYRALVKARCHEYNKRPDRRQEIAREITRAIEALDGRFIRQVTIASGKEVWVCCAPSAVRSKVKQALRDMAKQGTSSSCSNSSIDQHQPKSKNSYPESVASSAKPTKVQHDTESKAARNTSGARQNIRSLFLNPTEDTKPLASIEMLIRSRSMNQPRRLLSSFPDPNTSSWLYPSYGSSPLNLNGFNYGSIPPYRDSGLTPIEMAQLTIEIRRRQNT